MTAQLWLIVASGCVLFSALILTPAKRLHIPPVIVLLFVGLGARYATLAIKRDLGKSGRFRNPFVRT